MYFDLNKKKQFCYKICHNSIDHLKYFPISCLPSNELTGQVKVGRAVKFKQHCSLLI